MNKDLENIARQLSESDIQELMRIKKSEDKKLAELRQKRDKLAADLADLDAQLAFGGPEKSAKRKPRRGGRKPGSAAKAGPAKKAGKRGRARRGEEKVNMAGAVREAFEHAGTPLRARQVVDLLPEVGVEVADELDMRKRVSVILAQHKKSFQQIERGVYRLKQD